MVLSQRELNRKKNRIVQSTCAISNQKFKVLWAHWPWPSTRLSGNSSFVQRCFLQPLDLGEGFHTGHILKVCLQRRKQFPSCLAGTWRLCFYLHLRAAGVVKSTGYSAPNSPSSILLTNAPMDSYAQLWGLCTLLLPFCKPERSFAPGVAFAQERVFALLLASAQVPSSSKADCQDFRTDKIQM